MPAELSRLFGNLEIDQLGFRRPSKFIFFCGGAAAPDGPCKSLRDYLLNDQKIGGRIKAEIVLAETANQIWRKTSYPDLITFEEDIAKIAAMVLVIAESPGALAELGAFASIQTIRQFLAILIQEKFAEDEFFVRLGPVERIYKDNSDRVGFFPWLTRKNSTLIKSTVKPHIRNMIAFLNKILNAVPDTPKLSAHADLKEFILLYWVIFLSQAITVTKLTAYAALIMPEIDIHRVRQILYCMQIAGWVGSSHYSSLEYFYALFDADPLVYRFNPELPKAERDALRRRADVISAISSDLKLPKHIRKVAFAARKAAK